jgi:hypothetical protein
VISGTERRASVNAAADGLRKSSMVEYLEIAVEGAGGGISIAGFPTTAARYHRIAGTYLRGE